MAAAGTLDSTAPGITYTVDCRDPGRHVYHVTLELSNLSLDQHRLEMPVWTPGSYEVEDYARHVFDVAAWDQAGAPIEIAKAQKNVWVFQSHTPTVSIRYSVYAFQLGVSSSHLDDTHAYWNGATLFFSVDGAQECPIDLYIKAPAGWYASTGLPAADPDDGGAMHFKADNYDILVDSPVEVGTHRLYTFAVDGKRHTVAIWGSGNQDDAKLVADTRTIVEADAAMFGGLPYRDYTFIYHITDHGTGGLEHLNSTTCGFSREGFKPWKRYRRALSLIAHEFFHLWNVKRIHPDMLGPFNYGQEVHTHLLWAMEGFTSYFGDLSLVRSGLYSVKDYLDALASDIKQYERQPGRHVMSLSRSSFDTWMGEYRPDADRPNRGISYYLKGSLVGALMDLEIRRRTQSRRSLDDVLRLLFERYGRHGRGFPEHVYQDTVEEVAGGSMAEFFSRYIDGLDDIPLDDLLRTAGLEIHRVTKNPDLKEERDDQGDNDHDDAVRSDPPLAWLGIDMRTSGGKTVVRTGYDPGPAAGRLYPGDELLALDGYRITDAEAMETRIRVDYAPGDEVALHLFRRGALITRTVTLGEAPPNEYKIRRVKDPSADQKATYESWLHASWPDASAS